MKAYKVTTHDFRPPVQGGDPIFDGTVPYTLPPVEVDEGPRECMPGWNACRKASDAMRIAGLWPNGRSSILWEVETQAEVVERGDKLRAATWDILRRCSEEEVEVAVREMCTGIGLDSIFDSLVREQMLWREALSRPLRDEQEVVAGIRAALGERGLARWEIKRFGSSTAAWADWADWAAGAPWAAGAALAAWNAWAAWAAWDAWDAWDARDTLNVGAAWGTRDTLNVGAAMSVYVSGSIGWTRHNPYLLTTGVRDAYKYGAAIVLPVGEGIIGYAMEEETQDAT